MSGISVVLWCATELSTCIQVFDSVLNTSFMHGVCLVKPCRQRLLVDGKMHDDIFARQPMEQMMRCAREREKYLFKQFRRTNLAGIFFIFSRLAGYSVVLVSKIFD